MKGYQRGMSRRTAAEVSGPGTIKKTVVLKNFPITVAAAGAGVGFGTASVFDFPQGFVWIDKFTSDLVFSTTDADIAAAWDGDFSLGTAPDADGTLAGAEVDILASQATGPATAQVSPRQLDHSSATLKDAPFDNTDGSLEVNLNLLIDAANIADASNAVMLVNGTICFHYSVTGDD